MKPQNYFIITRKGALGLGEFPFHQWHKREKENILKAVGVKVEYGEELNKGEYRGTFRTVSDSEHAEIIRLYVEEGLSYEKIGEQLNRSSRTPLLHIQRHNRDVEKQLFSVFEKVNLCGFERSLYLTLILIFSCLCNSNG